MLGRIHRKLEVYREEGIVGFDDGKDRVYCT